MCVKNETLSCYRVVNGLLRAVSKAVQLDFFAQNERVCRKGYFKFVHLKLHSTFQDVATFWEVVKRLKGDVVEGLFRQDMSDKCNSCHALRNRGGRMKEQIEDKKRSDGINSSRKQEECQRMVNSACPSPQPAPQLHYNDTLQTYIKQPNMNSYTSI